MDQRQVTSFSRVIPISLWLKVHMHIFSTFSAHFCTGNFTLSAVSAKITLRIFETAKPIRVPGCVRILGAVHLEIVVSPETVNDTSVNHFTTFNTNCTEGEFETVFVVYPSPNSPCPKRSLEWTGGVNMVNCAAEYTPAPSSSGGGTLWYASFRCGLHLSS